MKNNEKLWKNYNRSPESFQKKLQRDHIKYVIDKKLDKKEIKMVFFPINNPIKITTVHL